MDYRGDREEGRRLLLWTGGWMMVLEWKMMQDDGGIHDGDENEMGPKDVRMMYMRC